jgi:hypothetical protein
MYGHPKATAEYVAYMNLQHKRRLWLERVIWAGIYLVFALPMFTGCIR